MNRHGEKKRWTSVPSCVESHFKTHLIWIFNLFVLTNFEITTMDSQEPTCCDNSHLLGQCIFLPTKMLVLEIMTIDISY